MMIRLCELCCHTSIRVPVTVHILTKYCNDCFLAEMSDREEKLLLKSQVVCTASFAQCVADGTYTSL